MMPLTEVDGWHLFFMLPQALILQLRCILLQNIQLEFFLWSIQVKSYFELLRFVQFFVPRPGSECVLQHDLLLLLKVDLFRVSALIQVAIFSISVIKSIQLQLFIVLSVCKLHDCLVVFWQTVFPVVPNIQHARLRKLNFKYSIIFLRKFQCNRKIVFKHSD